MSHTYTKRVWKHPDPQFSVSVYVNVVDSVKKSWAVYQNRRCFQTFSNIAAAITFATRLPHEPRQVASGIDVFVQAATEFQSQKPFEGPLDIRLLACLYVKKFPENSEERARYQNLSLLLAEVGPIPSKDSDFQVWFSDLLKQAQKRTTHEIKKKSGVKKRLDNLVRILKVVNDYPFAFKRYTALVNDNLVRIKLEKKEKTVALNESESYLPFTLLEIQKLLEDCQTFPEVALAIVYLASGLRSGEAERLNANHIVNGKIVLQSVVTKTKNQKTPPPASIALRAALDLTAKNTALPEKIEKKRFRPTTAVGLVQSNVPILAIKERLGHGSLAMLINHYAKSLPFDWGDSKSAAEYFKIQTLTVDGLFVGENVYDLFVLRLLLVQSSRFAKLDLVKGAISKFLTPVVAPVLNDAF